MPSKATSVPGSVWREAEDGVWELRILGVRVHPLTIDELERQIARSVDTRSRLCIGSQNLHGVYVFHRDESMRRFQENALVRVDGMALVFAARLCGFPVRREHRVTWVDWIDPLFRAAEARGWFVCYCGASEQTIQAARDVVSARYPQLRFQARNGYFDSVEDELAFVDETNRRSVDILIVGMGMPRQEQFVLRNGERIRAPVILTSGAAIEYLAGSVSTPPRWMGRVGLEWLFRLSEHPKRFGKRYLIEPWSLLPLFVRDIWRHRVRGGRS